LTQVVWSFAALADLRQIRGYIAQFNPSAAARLADRIIAAADGLILFPHRGTLVGDNLCQIMPVYPYLLRYEIVGDTVNILRVRHGMRDS